METCNPSVYASRRRLLVCGAAASLGILSFYDE